jgi:putative iron-only hydrogenase system regulator
MERRLGVVGIVIEDRKKSAPQVNQVLSEHGEIIAGRMGLPYGRRNVSVIALIVDGTTDELGSLAGRRGMLNGVSSLFFFNPPMTGIREAPSKGRERDG